MKGVVMDSVDYEGKAAWAGFVVLGSIIAFGVFLYYHLWLVPVLAALGFFSMVGLLFAPFLLPKSVRRWYRRRQLMRQ